VPGLCRQRKQSDHMKDVFILGCERSGSTWLGNILDAHPDVMFLMEPFADYIALFDDFPDRVAYADGECERLATIFRQRYSRIRSIKYPLLYRPGGTRGLMAVDRFLVEVYLHALRILGKEASWKIKQHIALNLNTSEIPISRQTPKRAAPAFRVTKELRLNFKVPVLARAFPDATILVAIRHPAAQISSILRLFHQERLGELFRRLPAFVQSVMQSDRFENYRSLIADAPLERLLPAWWLINYDVLLTDLSAYGMRYRLVSNEDLSADPLGYAQQVLGFCGLEDWARVSDYLKWSSSKGGRTPLPLATNRDSTTYYRKTIAEARPEVTHHIQQLLRSASGTLDPALEEYLRTGCELSIQERHPRETGPARH